MTNASFAEAPVRRLHMGPGDAAGSGTAIKGARFHVKRHLCHSGPGVIAAVFSWRLRSAEPQTVPVPAAPRFRQPRRRQTRPGPCAMTVRTPEHAGCFSYRGREPIPVGEGSGARFQEASRTYLSASGPTDSFTFAATADTGLEGRRIRKQTPSTRTCSYRQACKYPAEAVKITTSSQISCVSKVRRIPALTEARLSAVHSSNQGRPGWQVVASYLKQHRRGFTWNRASAHAGVAKRVGVGHHARRLAAVAPTAGVHYRR